MGIVPENISPRIAWYRGKLAPWAEHAALLGLTEAQVELLEEKVAAAFEKHNQQRMARDAARAATLSLHMAMDELSELGAQMIAQIRVKALQDGEGVYSTANVPPPADASPIGAPGQPTSFKVELRSDGSIGLKWKCKNPRGSEGTMYKVERDITGSGTGPFQLVGIAGKKQFVDESLPEGSRRVIYRVTAIRSTRRGQAGECIVPLGVNASWARAKAKLYASREEQNLAA